MSTQISTLVYAQRRGSVALLLRRKEPNLGLWSPPGGMVEPGETPLENAIKELEEETGLTARSARLAAVVTELDSRSGERWLMFVFHTSDVVGELGRETHEGAAAWIPIPDLPGLRTPPADPHIAAAALSRDDGVAFVSVRLDGGRLIGVTTTRDEALGAA